MVDVSTVLVSAAVATCVASAVTLLVEYAAKPQMEARKERILEQARRRRALVEELVEAENAVQATAHEVLANHNWRVAGNEPTEHMRSELELSFAALRRAGGELERVRRKYPDPEDDIALFAGYISGSLEGMGITQDLASDWTLVHGGSMLTILADAIAWARASKWQRRSPEMAQKHKHIQLVLDAAASMSERGGSAPGRQVG